jgi:hypothetical protein
MLPSLSLLLALAVSWRKIIVVCTVVAVSLCTLAACTNRIIPPLAPLNPRPIFVLDHGRHATLVLTAADRRIVRYAYGDWQYYAQRKTGLRETSLAAVWPTPAGLGRRELQASATPEGVRAAVQVGIEQLYEVTVDARAISRLQATLDALFQAQRETWLYNAAYDLEFVPHPEAYTLMHNSNRVVAHWLRALGCRVRGLLLFSRWQVMRPRPP